MKTRLKISLCIAVTLVALGALAQFLQWMNRPSDAWFITGALSTLFLFITVPALLYAIWRGSLQRPKRP